MLNILQDARQQHAKVADTYDKAARQYQKRADRTDNRQKRGALDERAEQLLAKRRVHRDLAAFHEQVAADMALKAQVLDASSGDAAVDMRQFKASQPAAAPQARRANIRRQPAMRRRERRPVGKEVVIVEQPVIEVVPQRPVVEEEVVEEEPVEVIAPPMQFI